MNYWDYNAGALLRPTARLALERALADPMANPSSVHAWGRRARAYLDASRELIAQTLGAQPSEIVLTGSGTEAAALAIKGSFAARANGRHRIVTSTIEHPAVLFACEQLEASGAEVVRIPVERNGQLDASRMIEALTPQTFLCSLMWANNETGVLQPVEEVARACQTRGVLFHTDAVQGFGKVPVSLRQVAADFVSVSGHKLGAPAGTGALYAARGIPLASTIAGHQEKGRRGGTPNAALWAAFAAALEESLADRDHEADRLRALRDDFETQVLAAVSGARINGEGAPRIPNTSNLQLGECDGEALLIALDLAGTAVSTGAACSSGTLRPSHVLTAMGLTAAQAHASLRFSIGWSTQDVEVAEVVRVIKAFVANA